MVCKIKLCDRKSTRKSMCELHYRRIKTHGHPGGVQLYREYHGMYGAPEYRAWSNMLTRCYNKNRKDYVNYGGRGIEVCDEWRKSFIAFYKSVGTRPSPKHSLDRIDNEKNYEPGNVKWSTRSEQNHNIRKKSTNLSGYKGVTYNKRTGKWIARITHNYKTVCLGTFENPIEASNAYLSMCSTQNSR